MNRPKRITSAVQRIEVQAHMCETALAHLRLARSILRRAGADSAAQSVAAATRAVEAAARYRKKKLTRDTSGSRLLDDVENLTTAHPLYKQAIELGYGDATSDALPQSPALRAAIARLISWKRPG